MACHDHTEYPGNTTHHVKEGKLLFIHAHNTGYDWCKGAHDRQKTRHDDSAAAMLFIEFMRIVQIFFLEQKAVAPVEHGRTDLSSKPIPYCIPQYTGYGYE